MTHAGGPRADATPCEIPTRSIRRRPALFGGRYRLSEPIGEGGTSTVYEAWDTLLERPVAVKIFHRSAAVHGGILAREARVLARVQHPNVVAVYAYDELHDPPFLVMERVEGRPLDCVLAERRIAFRDALTLLRAIAEGLEALHAAGTIHGDVKPANVLVGGGRVRLVDVGLVPLLERMEPGEVLGTPAYMAPERAAGTILVGEAAQRCDIYSFGVLAYELLTGRLPFPNVTRGRLLRPIVYGTPPLPSQVAGLAPILDAPILAAVSMDPAQRPASARTFVESLEIAARSVDRDGSVLRILVVDDDDDVRALFTEILSRRLPGALVESATDGPRGLDALSTSHYDVGVFDLRMPGMDGIELVREARAIQPLLDVVVCTGEGSGPEWSTLRTLGVKHFLIKPVDATRLVRTVHEIVDERARPSDAPPR